MKKASEEFKVGINEIGYVYSSFASRFSGQEFEMPIAAPSSKKIPRFMSDAEIESEFKPGSCTLGDVLAVLRSDNPEYKDGNWNLFYFEACVVDVNWNSGRGDWSVSAWGRGGGKWGAGNRVFSPATDAEALGTMPSETLALRLAELKKTIQQARVIVDAIEEQVSGIQKL